MSAAFSFVRRMSGLGTLLATRLWGVYVGTDATGLRYYRSRFKDWAGRESRWVLYVGEPEASRIPPEGRRWLQHAGESPLPDHLPERYVWQKPPAPNRTGTTAACLPPNHLLRRKPAARHRHEPPSERVWTPFER